MRFFAKWLKRSFFVKRISQARMWVYAFLLALHASRDTSDEERSSGSAIAVEALMNKMG
jgi:hypothetical protein